MLNPHFYRLRKVDRRRGLSAAAQKGDGERCERDYLTLVFRHRNSNDIGTNQSVAGADIGKEQDGVFSAIA